jgi:HlyD family secretion protein
MIREPSGQDRPLAKPTVGRPWRRWLSGGALAIAVIAGIGYVVRGWLGAERSADRSRIRIATVERGTLVRDIVSDGRVVAANSPTLYAIAAELGLSRQALYRRMEKLGVAASSSAREPRPGG